MTTDQRPLILVVEADAEQRKALCRALFQSGYDTLAATSGAAAIAMLAQHRPTIALVLLNPQLPDMSGEDTCRYLFKRHPGLRCLIYSDTHDAALIERLLKTGPSAYLTKTGDLAVLTEKIRALLSGPSRP